MAVTGGDEGYLVAEPGEGLLVVADEVVVVALVAVVVVVLAGLGVVLVIPHDCPGDAGQGVGDRDGRFLLVAPAEPAGQAAEAGAGPAAGAGGGPCRLDHRGAQVLVAFAGGGVLALPGGLVVAGRQPGPGGQPGGSGEAGHVPAGLRHDHLGGALPDPGDRELEPEPAGALTCPHLPNPRRRAAQFPGAHIVDGSLSANKLVANIVVAGIVDGTLIVGAQFIAYGTNGEILIYSGTPAEGNLIGSWSGASGTDDESNAYPAGLLLQGNGTDVITVQGSSGQNIMIEITAGGVPEIVLATGAAEEATPASIEAFITDAGANEAMTLFIYGPQGSTYKSQTGLFMNSATASGTFEAGANLAYIDESAVIHYWLGWGGRGLRCRRRSAVMTTRIKRNV